MVLIMITTWDYLAVVTDCVQYYLQQKVTLLISIFLSSNTQARCLHHKVFDSSDPFSWSILQIKNRSKAIMWYFWEKVHGKLCFYALSYHTYSLYYTSGQDLYHIEELSVTLWNDHLNECVSRTQKRAIQFNFSQLWKLH